MVCRAAQACLCRNRIYVAENLGPAAQVAAGVSCVGWMAVSSGLIMLNKHLMSTDGFHFPMGLSLLGMGFSSIASYIACRARPDPVPGNQATRSRFQPPP